MANAVSTKYTDLQHTLALLLYFLKLLVITIMHMGMGPREEELLSASRSGVS